MGFTNSWSVAPNSISSPKYMYAVKSETRAACCMLWVTISTAKIEELIDELKEDYTIVIVTHNMQPVSYTHLTLPTTPYV